MSVGTEFESCSFVVGRRRKTRLATHPALRRGSRRARQRRHGRVVPVRGFHSLWWPEGPCRQVGNLLRVGNLLGHLQTSVPELVHAVLELSLRFQSGQ